MKLESWMIGIQVGTGLNKLPYQFCQASPWKKLVCLTEKYIMKASTKTLYHPRKYYFGQPRDKGAGVKQETLEPLLVSIFFISLLFLSLILLNCSYPLTHRLKE